MKIKTLFLLGVIVIMLSQSLLIAQTKKGSVENEEIYAVRDDGFSFYITGKILSGGGPIKEFNEIDTYNIEYPVYFDDVRVLFPIDNLVQIHTGFLLKTTLPWEDITIVSSDKKYTIKTTKLLRISFKKYVQSFDEFNDIFKNVVKDKMEPIQRKDALENFVYQFDGQKLIYIRKTKLPEQLEKEFELKTRYAIISKVKLSDVAVFIPYLKIMYLTNGYKVFLSDEYIKNFENRYNPRRLFFITSASLRKKAEELFMENMRIKYENLWKATKMYRTIGTKEEEAAEKAKEKLPQIEVGQ